MATVLNPVYAPKGPPSMGEMLGGIFNQHIGRMQEQGRTAKGLKGLVGPEQAQQLSMLPPNMAQAIIPQIIKSAQSQAANERWRSSRGVGNQGQGQGQDISSLMGSLKQVPEFDTQGMETPVQYGEDGLAVPSQLGEGAVGSRSQEGAQSLMQQLGGQAQPQQQPGIPGYTPGLAGERVIDAGGSALQAEQAEQKAEQKALERVQAEEGKSKAELQKRITGGLTVARAKSEELNKRITSNRESENNYNQIYKMMATGKPMVGLTNKILGHFGLDKSVSNWETQIVDKMLAAEPIRALNSLPAQAARLSKVFDTIQDMHGKTINSPTGLKYISRLKMAEAKAGQIIDNAHLKRLTEYQKAGLEPPFDLEQQVAKEVEKEVEPLMREAEFILSDSMEEMYPSLKGVPIGKKFRDDESGQVFKRSKVGTREFWEQTEE